MRTLKAITTIFFLIQFSLIVSAQNNTASHNVNVEIPEVALLGLVSSSQTQTLSANEAGNTVSFATPDQENSVWLNYSSVKRSQNHSRKITAFVDGEVPAGINLRVTAKPATNNGNGDVGQSIGTTELNSQSSDIITNIGSCYTGQGANHGYNLVYSLDVEDEELLASNDQNLSFNVVYTLTD